jgi:hypothetical protein
MRRSVYPTRLRSDPLLLQLTSNGGAPAARPDAACGWSQAFVMAVMTKGPAAGRLGALLGEQVVTAGPGIWVFKPREQWHTFWNPGDTPCEIIEVISPAAYVGPSCRVQFARHQS